MTSEKSPQKRGANLNKGLLQAAADWIAHAPHRDDCFVSDHYEGDPGNQCNCGKDSLLAAIEADDPDAWQPMETAPKNDSSDPILLLFEGGKQSVAYWDPYYAEGGSGFTGGIAWIEPVSGERVDRYYGSPLNWQPLTTSGKPSAARDEQV